MYIIIIIIYLILLDIIIIYIIYYLYMVENACVIVNKATSISQKNF